MAWSIGAVVFPGLPGSVRLSVQGTPNAVTSIVRNDGSREAQPVRNWSAVPVSGLGVVIDCEAPLGRPVTYNLLSAAGAVLATTAAVTAAAPPDGRSLLRSVLRPSVAWMWVEGQDETGVEWRSSTSVHVVVGRDTPTVISEVRQRRTGTFTYLCKSIDEADKLVSLLRDGTLMLLRHSPCAGVQTRDLLHYPLDVTERRYGRQGWRLLSVEYQASRFVPGNTLEPQWGWDFGALRDSAPDFQTLTGRYKNFGGMALDERAGVVLGEV